MNPESKQTRFDSIKNFVKEYAPEGFSTIEETPEFITLICTRDIAPRAAVDYRRAKQFCTSLNRCYSQTVVAECSAQDLITRIVIAISPA